MILTKKPKKNILTNSSEFSRAINLFMSCLNYLQYITKIYVIIKSRRKKYYSDALVFFIAQPQPVPPKNQGIANFTPAMFFSPQKGRRA